MNDYLSFNYESYKRGRILKCSNIHQKVIWTVSSSITKIPSQLQDQMLQLICLKSFEIL